MAWLVAALIGAGHTASEPIGEMVAGARISLAPLVAMSIVLSLYFLRTGKLWPVAFAHIFADFAGFSTS